MTYSEWRKLLRTIPRLRKRLEVEREIRQTILDEIDSWEAKRYPHGQTLTGMPHGTGVSNQTEDTAIKMLTLRERYAERLASSALRIEKLETTIHAVDLALCELTGLQEQILRLRYFKGLSMTETARELHIDRRYCYKLEIQAFDTMGENWND